jgi:lysozyme family protein
MQRVAKLNGQPAARQPGPASSTARVTDPGLGRSGSGSGAKGSVAFDPHGEAPREAFRFVLEHEGSGYVASDAGKESSKYGILQATATRYGYNGDVRHLSQTEAEAIYRKIWDESGSRNLPAGLALVHFDTYMNSPQAAKKMLHASGGDTDTYLRLRTQRYTRLSQLKPAIYARYMKGWMKRIHDLRTVTAQTGPSLTKASV